MPVSSFRARPLGELVALLALGAALAVASPAAAEDQPPYTLGWIVDTTAARSLDGEAVAEWLEHIDQALQRAMFRAHDARVLPASTVRAALDELGAKSGRCGTACQKKAIAAMGADLAAVVALSEERRGGFAARVEILAGVRFRSLASVKVKSDRLVALVAHAQQKVGKLAASSVEKARARGVEQWPRSAESDSGGEEDEGGVDEAGSAEPGSAAAPPDAAPDPPASADPDAASGAGSGGADPVEPAPAE